MRTHQDTLASRERARTTSPEGRGLIVAAFAALLSASAAAAQAPSEPSPALPGAVGGEAGESKPFVDLTHRYRFIERYTSRDEPGGAGAIGPYRVAIRETFRDAIESPDGPTRPTEVVRRTIFTERPAETSGIGAVSASIRAYERFESRPDEPAPSGSPAPLDGLTIWLRPRTNEAPLIVSLSPGRRLTDREYEVASRQVFMPDLAAVLPSYAVRVGDGWRVPRRAVQAMLGEAELRGDALTGKFLELRRDGDGGTTYAVLTVTGRAVGPVAETTVNARVLFAFPTPVPGKLADLVRPTDESTVDARGAITELRLARVSGGAVPGEAKGGRYKSTREIVLERKPGIDGKAGSIKVVEAPAVTEANSWLTYLDPKGRFVFQHPQTLLPPERYRFAAKPEGDSILLVKSRPDGRDLVRIEVFAKERTPEALKSLLANQWKQTGAEVLPGLDEWLAEKDWPGMKVYQVEAALKLPSRTPRGARLHYDAYLVTLTKDASMTVVATTTRDAVAAFRREVEQMMKTFRLGVGGT